MDINSSEIDGSSSGGVDINSAIITDSSCYNLINNLLRFIYWIRLKVVNFTESEPSK